MIYPTSFEDKIGFKHIRELLKDRCLSEMGEECVDKISFSSDYDLIKYNLSITNEFKTLLYLKGQFPSQDYLNMTPKLLRLRLEGSVIELEKIFDLKISLRALYEIIKFLNEIDCGEYPLLSDLVVDLFNPENIYHRLEQILDEKGSIRDKASSKLAEIRKKLRGKKGEITGRVQRSLKEAKSSGWTSKDAEPSIRGGRLVIPVGVTHKRKLQGFIHDESASGQTVYIEPAEVFDTNNEIRELENAERREIGRILGEFTELIRPHLQELIDLYNFMGEVDFIRAKARFAQEIDANMPELLNQAVIEWFDARHPLLYLSLQSHNKKIVPLNIALDNNQRILVISGPERTIQFGMYPSIS